MKNLFVLLVMSVLLMGFTKKDPEMWGAISPELAAEILETEIGNSGHYFNPVQDCNGVWIISPLEISLSDFIEGVDYTLIELCPYVDPCDIDPENCE